MPPARKTENVDGAVYVTAESGVRLGDGTVIEHGERLDGRADDAIVQLAIRNGDASHDKPDSD